MFKSRRRSYRKSYRQPFPLVWLLPTIPLVLIFLELAIRLIVGITGNSDELAVYEGEPAIVTAYRLKFQGQNQQPYDGLSDRGQLAVQRHLAGGYGLVGNQKNQFWRINEQGFRDDNPVPLKKTKGEIRIFLLGGSTAFGQGNASNQSTIASKLEARLNERIAQQRRSPEKYRPAVLPFYKPDLIKALALPIPLQDGQYRVINAAVPGYTSGNELAQLALQILPYSPDAIIVLNGYGDLMLPSNKTITDIPNVDAFLNNSLGHFWTHLSRQLKQSLSDSYLVKVPQYWLFHPQPSVSRLSLLATDETASLERQLTTNSAELERRVARYRENHKRMVRL
ncbi:MAG: SGNH/GDSL hydrolase family protein, partial [Coleofasciculus sp. S288]|nr:SGNH/GDSL hydrolase family protein [Coleofasciculus sp. S288]